MSQHNYTLTLPVGNYNGATFTGRCDEYSIAIAEGSSARDMNIAGLRFAQISAPGVDMTGLKAEASSIITLNAPGSTLEGACFRGATLGMSHNLPQSMVQNLGSVSKKHD